MKRIKRLISLNLAVIMLCSVFTAAFLKNGVSASEPARRFSAGDMMYTLLTYYGVADTTIATNDLLFAADYALEGWDSAETVVYNLEQMWPGIYQAGIDGSSVLASYAVELANEFGEASALTSEFWTSLCSSLVLYGDTLANGAEGFLNLSRDLYDSFSHSFSSLFNILGDTNIPMSHIDTLDDYKRLYDEVCKLGYPQCKSPRLELKIQGDGSVSLTLKGLGVNIFTAVNYNGHLPSPSGTYGFRTYATSYIYFFVQSNGTLKRSDYPTRVNDLYTYGYGTLSRTTALIPYFYSANYNNLNSSAVPGRFINGSYYNADGKLSSDNDFVVPAPPVFYPDGSPQEVPQVAPSYVQTAIQTIDTDNAAAPEEIKKYKDDYVVTPSLPDPDPIVPPVVNPSPGQVVQPDAPAADDPTGEGDAGSDTEANSQYLAAGLTDKFPFCLPYDAVNLLKAFQAERKAPVIEWKIKIDRFGIDYDLVLDFSVFDPVAAILRFLELILFAIGLMAATRHWILA